jgi:hypothetical protein
MSFLNNSYSYIIKLASVENSRDISFKDQCFKNQESTQKFALHSCVTMHQLTKFVEFTGAIMGVLRIDLVCLLLSG